MKKNTLFLIFFALTIHLEPRAQKMTVMTYNIRYDNPADGPDNWHHRKFRLCRQIEKVSPVVFGIQEGLDHQVAFIDSLFPAYRHIGSGRDDGEKRGEYCAIWYNPNFTDLILQGTFWLSPTPHRVSVGWDAALPRICTYGKFRDKSGGKSFLVFNTHLDHIGTEARKQSVSLILAKIDSLNQENLPIILMGDMNSLPESEPIQKLLKRYGGTSAMNLKENTFNGFNPRNTETIRIDYIFAGGGFVISRSTVIREITGGHFPSDHFPVVSEVIFPQ